jgi:ABC-type antimicrobial peptide transport system permease subunit
MKIMNMLNSTIRSPVKTIITFLLVVAVSFGLLSQIGEFTATNRVINRSEEMYNGVGTFESENDAEKYDTSMGAYIYADPRTMNAGLYCPDETVRIVPDTAFTQNQIADVLDGLNHIQNVDYRVMTAGISDTYFRPDDGDYFYPLPDYCIVEGTLEKVAFNDDGILMIGNVICGSNQIFLSDCRLLAGNPGRVIDGSEIIVWAYPETVTEFEYLSGALKRKVTLYDTSFHYGTEYLHTMIEGDRYVLLIKYDTLYQERYSSGSDTSDFHLSGQAIRNNYCEPIRNITGLSTDYLETEDFADLKLMCEIIDADDHTFDMVYTSDMSAITRFAAGKMAMLEGRMLTPEDSKNEANVCVISKTIAEENHLQVGDVLNFKLGTELFKQYKGVGALALTPSRYSKATEEVELTVVGIYVETESGARLADNANWCYSEGTVFLPLSLLPNAVDLTEHTYTPAEYSFSVKAQEMSAFLQEDAPQIEKLGLTLIFEDRGWPEIMASYITSKNASLIRIIALSVATIITISFTVYLFIGRRKKEYAIMRALGVKKEHAKITLLFSIGSLASFAVIVGLISAWMYLERAISSNETILLLESSKADYEPSLSVVVFAIMELLVIYIIALIYLYRMEKTPLLLLLQDNNERNRRKKIEKVEPTQSEVLVIKANEAVTQLERPLHGKSRFCFLRNYICRHIFRQKGKSIFTIVLAALLLCAICQYSFMRDSYKNLCEETTVKAKFTQGIPLYEVMNLIAKEYTKDPYYEKTTDAELNLRPVTMVVTNDVIRYAGKLFEIKYADGYDESCMSKPNAIILVSKNDMELYDWEMGQMVRALRTQLKDEWIRKNGYSSYDDLNEGEKQRLDNFLLENSCEYCIAGIITGIDNLVFTPGVIFVNPGTGENEMSLDYAEVTLADYTRAAELQKAGERIYGTTMIFDTEALDGARGTLQLLSNLYPMVIAIVLLIGGFITSLAIMQSSKETAILRILGASKQKTRRILCGEQVSLTVVGLMLGSVALILWKGQQLIDNYLTLLVFAGLYLVIIIFTAMVCAILVTNKRLLSLLQTKE